MLWNAAANHTERKKDPKVLLFDPQKWEILPWSPTHSETHGCLSVYVWVLGGRLAGISYVWMISWRWNRSRRPKQIWELRGFSWNVRMSLKMPWLKSMTHDVPLAKIKCVPARLETHMMHVNKPIILLRKIGKVTQQWPLKDQNCDPTE